MNELLEKSLVVGLAVIVVIGTILFTLLLVVFILGH